MAREVFSIVHIELKIDARNSHCQHEFYRFLDYLGFDAVRTYDFSQGHGCSVGRTLHYPFGPSLMSRLEFGVGFKNQYMLKSIKKMSR